MSNLLYDPPILQKKKRRYLFQVTEGFFPEEPLFLRNVENCLYFFNKKQDIEKKENLTEISRAIPLDDKKTWELEATIPSQSSFALNEKYLLWQKRDGKILLREKGKRNFNSKQYLIDPPPGQVLFLYAGDKIYLVNKEGSGHYLLYFLENKKWIPADNYRSSQEIVYQEKGDQALLLYPESLATLGQDGLGKIYLSPLIPEDIEERKRMFPGPRPGQYFFLEKEDLFFLDLERHKKERIYSYTFRPDLLSGQGDRLATLHKDQLDVFQNQEHLFSFRGVGPFSKITFIEDGLILWKPRERFYQKISFAL